MARLGGHRGQSSRSVRPREVSGRERAMGVSRGGGPIVGGRCPGGSRWWGCRAVTASTMGNIRGVGDEGARRYLWEAQVRS